MSKVHASATADIAVHVSGATWSDANLRAAHTNVALHAIEMTPPAAGAPSSEAVVLTAERDAALRRALATLDDRNREVIYLRYFLDLSEAEMAAVLHCRPGTVKSRLSRALARLRAVVEAEDG